MRPAPVAFLVGGPFVSVYRSVADAVHARRFYNPNLPRRRVQNVVIIPCCGSPRLRTAIRHLKASG
jgi:hypothetical protein